MPNIGAFFLVKETYSSMITVRVIMNPVINCLSMCEATIELKKKLVMNCKFQPA